MTGARGHHESRETVTGVAKKSIVAVTRITREGVVTVVTSREVSSDPGRSGEHRSNDRDHQENRGGVTGITKRA